MSTNHILRWCGCSSSCTISWLLAGFGLCCVLRVPFGLPETLPAERRAQVGVGHALMFAYISGSPFVAIGLYGAVPQNYGRIFGANALGLITTSQINRWLLARYPSGTILGVALACIAGALPMVGAIAACGMLALIIYYAQAGMMPRQLSTDAKSE